MLQLFPPFFMIALGPRIGLLRDSGGAAQAGWSPLLFRVMEGNYGLFLVPGGSLYL